MVNQWLQQPILTAQCGSLLLTCYIETGLDAVRSSPFVGPYPHPWDISAASVCYPENTKERLIQVSLQIEKLQERQMRMVWWQTAAGRRYIGCVGPHSGGFGLPVLQRAGQSGGQCRLPSRDAIVSSTSPPLHCLPALQFPFGIFRDFWRDAGVTSSPEFILS